jgi:hypothetical protein
MEIRTSMGPSAGGFTCSLAELTLPSSMVEMWLATFWLKSGESTAAFTLNVGTEEMSA